jgi:F-type H+-transporting ATPase subunit delta
MGTNASNKKTRIEPVAKVYAAALFEQAKEQGVLDNLVQELVEMKKVFAESKDFLVVLASSAFSLEQRTLLVKEYCTKAGISSLGNRFLELLVQKRRIELFENIVDGFMDLLDDEKGIIRGTLTTVDAVSSAQKEDIAKAFSRKTGKQVILEQQIDKDILGGLIVSVKGITFDGSLRTTVNNLKETLERQSV